MNQLDNSINLIKVIVLALALTGCTATFHVAPDDFIKQVAEKQSKTERTAFIPTVPIFFNRYDANNIATILCKDENGNLVYLVPDQNTQLEITSKSTGDIVKMYFNTVFFEGNKLIGLRSRLVPGMRREIELSDIEKILIYAEFPRTEKAD